MISAFVSASRTSAYGYGKKTTLALDALAARGVAFDHAYAVASDTQRAIAPLVSGIDLSSEAFPHMAVREGLICGVPVRLFRVSFTGDVFLLGQ